MVFDWAGLKSASNKSTKDALLPVDTGQARLTERISGFHWVSAYLPNRVLFNFGRTRGSLSFEHLLCVGTPRCADAHRMTTARVIYAKVGIEAI